jgi:hypothetical protein
MELVTTSSMLHCAMSVNEWHAIRSCSIPPSGGIDPDIARCAQSRYSKLLSIYYVGANGIRPWTRLAVSTFRPSCVHRSNVFVFMNIIVILCRGEAMRLSQNPKAGQARRLAPTISYICIIFLSIYCRGRPPCRPEKLVLRHSPMPRPGQCTALPLHYTCMIAT